MIALQNRVLAATGLLLRVATLAAELDWWVGWGQGRK
jgi:hypothetical protein